MKRKKRLENLAAAVFALLVWQIAAMTVKSKILLVSPVEVAVRMTTVWQVEGFLDSILFSFCHISIGFLLALVTASVLAALAGKYRVIETALRPFLVTIKTVPVASFVVICLIWLTDRNLSTFISFLIVLPIVYGNLLEGIKNENIQMLELAKVFKMSPLRKLKYIHLVELKPYIISACSTALGMSWKAGVAAEIIGTPDGSIGRMLYLAKTALDTDDLLCWTVIIVLLSVIFEKLFMLVLSYSYKRLEQF